MAGLQAIVLGGIQAKLMALIMFIMPVEAADFMQNSESILKKEIERDFGQNLASDYIQLDIIILLKIPFDFLFQPHNTHNRIHTRTHIHNCALL